MIEEYERKKKIIEQEKRKKAEAERRAQEEIDREKAERRSSHEQIQRNDRDQKFHERKVEARVSELFLWDSIFFSTFLS